MSYLDTLKQWDEAVALVDKAVLPQALEILVAIQEPNSKIYFNIGCLHLINQDLEAAEKAFDRSIGKDDHLAVAFFQRGITFYKKERYEESHADFKNALKELRGNQLIDYKALGLRHKLFACEVLHNMALTEAHQGNWKKAQEHLVSALDYKTESKLGLLDRALQSTLKQNLFMPALVPPTALFRPNKNFVAELEKRDYLGKSKVISSIIPQDEFSGFAPLQPQVQDGPSIPKSPEVLRALEGEPHIVRFEFVPETSGELAVVPGNVVFVLKKYADNWASVVFNGRRGLVPYNYLELMEVNSPLSPKQDGNSQNIYLADLPRKRAPSPPTTEGSKASLDLKQGQDEKNNTKAEAAEDDSVCIVKVHYTFNLALCVDIGTPFTLLVERIGRKLKLPAETLTLSRTAPAAGLTVMDGTTDMQEVWASANCGRITVWCSTSDQTIKEEPEVRVTMVALYSYQGVNPEDLSFQQGDSIQLLAKVDQNWFEGECNGSTGIFPASFVEPPVDTP